MWRRVCVGVVVGVGRGWVGAGDEESLRRRLARVRSSRLPLGSAITLTCCYPETWFFPAATRFCPAEFGLAAWNRPRHIRLEHLTSIELLHLHRSCVAWQVANETWQTRLEIPTSPPSVCQIQQPEQMRDPQANLRDQALHWIARQPTHPRDRESSNPSHRLWRNAQDQAQSSSHPDKRATQF
jgi:hypothetical protein